MAKVYLETSFFSACVSTRTSDKSKGWRASSLEWWSKQSLKFDLFISPEVVRELTSPDLKNKDKAVAMLQGLDVLDHTPEALAFGELLAKCCTVRA